MKEYTLKITEDNGSLSVVSNINGLNLLVVLGQIELEKHRIIKLAEKVNKKHSKTTNNDK